jgi:hypothetical protein
VEPSGTGAPDLGAELERIEAAVDGGSTDLRALGFWGLVARVKRDQALVAAHADRIGRIDSKAFRARVRPRFPVWAGNLVLLAGAAAGGIAVWLALTTDSPELAGISLVAAGAVWTVALHSPAHWLVGRLVGMGFTDYFIGGPPPPRPSLKIDYATYLRTGPSKRAWMHASGAIATKLAPFLALAFWPATAAPVWAAIVLVGIGVLSIVTDLLFSFKLSDWKKVRRELAVARDVG